MVTAFSVNKSIPLWTLILQLTSTALSSKFNATYISSSLNFLKKINCSFFIIIGLYVPCFMASLLLRISPKLHINLKSFLSASFKLSISNSGLNGKSVFFPFTAFIPYSLPYYKLGIPGIV